MDPPGRKPAAAPEDVPSPEQHPTPSPSARDEFALGQTVASATSLPPLDLGATPPQTARSQAARSQADRPQADDGLVGSLPPLSESVKRLRETPPEVLESLRRSRPSQLADEELPRGASIGRYIVVSCVGSGGMGVVYAAYDPELDRKVATKLLRASAGGGSRGQGRQRLMREAQAMARLSHPQVIGVFDVGTLGDQVFIAMEFVDGGTLTSWLEEAPRSQSEIIEKFTLAGRGLSAAHAAGLVHRDFKPDNVLVGKDGRVRVMDFGLAHSVGTEEDLGEQLELELVAEAQDKGKVTGKGRNSSSALGLRLTRTGALLGTPRYMSPEQYEGKKTDPRTDQFSFCVALYEALCKVPPFAGDTLATLGFNVVHGHVLSPPPDARVPARIRQAILRGLSIRPADRFPTMDALLEALNPQPRALSKAWLVTSAVLALAIGGNLGYQQLQRRKVALCQNAAVKLAGIWDPDRKQAVKSAVLATGQAFAADSWKDVEQTLDAYTRDWVGMRAEACSSLVHGDQVKGLHDLRMRCLDRRLEEVAALVNVLSNPDELIVESAANAAHSLTPISGCSNIEALTAPTPLPDNPLTRSRVEQVSKQLDAIRAMERFGKFGELRSLAEDAVRAATATRYRPAEAEALYLLGQILDLSGVYLQAEETLLRAAVAAIEGRDQRRLAEAWILLVQVTGFRLHDASKAGAWIQVANAALDIINDPEPLRAQLLLSTCMVASQALQYPKAIEACQQALQLREKINGPQSFEAGEVMLVMAGVYRRTEQFALAMDLYTKVLALQTQHVGPFHPEVRSATRGIALLFRQQRKYAEADTNLRKALEMAQISMGPRHIRSSDYLLLLTTNLLSQNRLEEAEQIARHCVDVRERPTPPDDDPGRRSEAHYWLGEVLQREGKYEEALAQYHTALDTRQRMPERPEEQIAYSLNAIGETLAAMGKPRDGLPYLERALSYRESRPFSEAHSLSQQALARTEFSLARVLWTLARKDQKKRALELAGKARKDYEEYGLRPDNDQPAVTQWLAEHTGPAPGLAAPVAGQASPATPTAPAKPAAPPPELRP